MEAEKIMVEVMLVAEVEITVEVVVFITMSLNWQHAVSIVLAPMVSLSPLSIDVSCTFQMSLSFVI